MKHVNNFKKYNTLSENNTEQTFENNAIYLKDIDKDGIITYMSDDVVKYVIVSDADGKQYELDTYTYIRSHFDELVNNGRIIIK